MSSDFTGSEVTVVTIGFHSGKQHSFKHISCTCRSVLWAKSPFSSVGLFNVRWKRVMLLLKAWLNILIFGVYYMIAFSSTAKSAKPYKFTISPSIAVISRTIQIGEKLLLTKFFYNSEIKLFVLSICCLNHRSWFRRLSSYQPSLACVEKKNGRRPYGHE